MRRNSRYHYFLQWEVGNGLRESGFDRWSELKDEVESALSLNGTEQQIFRVFGQTKIGKGKVRRELEKLGETQRIYNLGGGDVRIKRWEIEVKAKRDAKGKLIMNLH